ncbi:MAG: hypothetical protein M1827_007766 [Pycnora praestabilis]|nr:MAG: hypothetical protein M1827_007766 [Pycnora praestabilis]
MSSKINSSRGASNVTTSSNATNGNTESNSMTARSDKSSSSRDAGASKHEQASTSFREYEVEDAQAFHEFANRRAEAKKKISQYVRAYADIEGTHDWGSNLQLMIGEKDVKLQEKDIEIQRLNLGRQMQVDDFQIRYDDWSRQHMQWKSTKKELEERLREVNTRAEAAEGAQVRLRETAKQLDTEKRNLAALNQKFDKANEFTDDLETNLKRCNGRLREWDKYVSVLVDVDFVTLGDKLNQLFTHCCDIISSNLLADLPPALLADHGQWSKVTTLLHVPIGLPPTNSAAAKNSRKAAALHILATCLDANIFKPCYIPDRTVASETMKELLGHMARVDVRKEAVTRALLLSEYNLEEVEGAIEHTVEETSDEILTLLT